MLRQPGGSGIARGNESGIGLVRVLLGAQRIAAPEPTLFRPQCNGIVERLHDQEHDRASAPADRPKSLDATQRMAEHASQPHQRPRQSCSFADQAGIEQGHEIAAATVGDEFDMGIGIDVDAATDGNVVPGAAILRQTHGEDRLAVGAHQFTETVADPGQRATVLEVGEQRVAAQRAGGNHHAARGKLLAALEEPGARALGGDQVAVAAVSLADGLDIRHQMLGVNLHALLLGEPQVVLDQRVLGADAAADAAGAAARAACSLRAFAAEIGIGDLLARLAEEHRAGSTREAVFGAVVTGDFAQQLLIG